MAKRKSKVKVVARPRQAKAQVTKKEVGLLGQALRSLGGAAGGAVGSMFGVPLAGASAGSGLGATISRWLGAGDYNVSSNSLVNSVKASGSIPSMHSNDQSVVVRHKEFICEVLSNTTFTVNKTLTINPGNAATFPWLSRLANSYQQYRIKGMVFHYVPTSGSLSAGTNNALGTVMLQTSYRSSDTAPTTKVEMLNEYWATESVPSETFVHPIECNPNENPFNVQYIRGTDVVIPAGDSPLLYDLGSTHLATSGQQAAGVTLGDLYVTYEVELKKPIISSNVTTSSFLYASYRQSAPTFADPFGTGSSNVGNMVISFSTARTMNLPAALFGEFWIVVRYQGAFTQGSTAGASTVTNCTVVNWSTFTNRYEDNIGVGGTSAAITYCLRVSKFQRESIATVLFPLASAGAGTPTTVLVDVLGTPADV